MWYIGSKQVILELKKLHIIPGLNYFISDTRNNIKKNHQSINSIIKINVYTISSNAKHLVGYKQPILFYNWSQLFIGSSYNEGQSIYRFKIIDIINSKQKIWAWKKRSNFFLRSKMYFHFLQRTRPAFIFFLFV